MEENVHSSFDDKKKASKFPKTVTQFPFLKAMSIEIDN